MLGVAPPPHYTTQMRDAVICSQVRPPGNTIFLLRHWDTDAVLPPTTLTSCRDVLQCVLHKTKRSHFRTLDEREMPEPRGTHRNQR
ncbi:hypothetical protein NDU88_005753 [Pleurodeles waltl]|uniref:Uncharacterized protein n=1 Tax=Pleurodeles waltl TaxID=8319 RepID=A0AAV7SMI7_PLEWA|nr:hypothetical protein NDU88_005753 [Pleurodeles waltl]